MPEAQLDLLTEPIITVDLADQRRRLTLPGVLAALCRGEEIEFSALRPHQQHPWHAFLCQVGALASHHHLGGELPGDEESWRKALLALSGSCREAWCLLVDDLSKPAFLQPPVPEKTLTAFAAVMTPGELDILVTAKNHEVKGAQMAAPDGEAWVQALIALQTFQGYSGRDNHGVARMNGGLGSRPNVAYARSLSWSWRVRDDVALLLQTRAAIIDKHSFSARGKALLWLEPWDGSRSLSLGDCDPFFVEVCRRVRLATADGRPLAFVAPSKVPRLDAKERKGDVGDAWTPIKAEDPPAALSVPGAGFSYKLTHALLFGEGVAPAPAQRPLDGGELLFVAQVLSRGQGKTEGYHERLLPIPARARASLLKKDERERLNALAKRRIQRVDTARLKLLKPALCMLLQGGPDSDKLDYKDERPSRWTERLDQQVDRLFFERLWEDADLPGEEADRRWDQLLVELSAELLEAASHEAPIPHARRYRALAQAERFFRRSARQNFPHANLSPRRSEHDRSSEST